MTIVVDTNVFISACLGQGAASKVIEASLRGVFIPLMGTALLTEYEDVLARDSLFRKSRLTPVERAQLLDIFLSTCRWTRIYFGWRPNLPDEADNHLIELAVAGGAGHIVTSNLRDLRRAELSFPGIAIVTPIQFLKDQSR